MSRDTKIIVGILFLFGGFYALAQKVSGSVIAGLLLSAIGLYLILSELK